MSTETGTVQGPNHDVSPLRLRTAVGQPVNQEAILVWC